MNHLQANGVQVQATIVDVVTLPSGGDPPDHDVYFLYTYEGKEYTYVDLNYRDGRTIGKTVTAYVYPERPDELILSDGRTSGSFFVFLLGFAVISGTAGYLGSKDP